MRIGCMYIHTHTRTTWKHNITVSGCIYSRAGAQRICLLIKIEQINYQSLSMLSLVHPWVVSSSDGQSGAEQWVGHILLKLSTMLIKHKLDKICQSLREYIQFIKQLLSKQHINLPLLTPKPESVVLIRYLLCWFLQIVVSLCNGWVWLPVYL